jgi:diaminohydroxyphosphoribosylaminopyrimidine deaminase/5-amino-6-(5-phosphoribosylamino)uracil reductase
LVGAVVLNPQGNVAGEGFHTHYGGPHAEVQALVQAGPQAQGGTLVLNLEPCHHQGKTPPCTAAIATAGIAHVHFALADPNPVAAGGQAWLQQQGIGVSQGLLAAEAEALNEPFLTFQRQQRPFVALKLAQTLDGKLATRTGHSQWVSSPLARAWVHQQRARYEALLTTAATVLADNPQLTLRQPPHTPECNPLQRVPVRVVVDAPLKLAEHPERWTIFGAQAQYPTWVLCQAPLARSPQAQRLEALGVRVLGVEGSSQGLCPTAVVNVLGQAGLTSLWMEAGGRWASACLAAGVVNALEVIVAPKWLGDGQAVSAWPASEGAEPLLAMPLTMPTALWRVQHTQALGDDVLMRLRRA